MATLRNFNPFRIVTLTCEPEHLLIIAVYAQARKDLFSDTKLQRRDAELFFELDGFDPNEIRERYIENVKNS